jgi:protein SCO1/2
MIRLVIAAVLMSLTSLAWGVDSLPQFEKADLTPFWPAELPKGTTKEVAQVEAFTLTNQAGKVVTASSLDGHLSVVHFFFATCHDVCPRMVSQVQRLQRELASIRGLRFYSVSVTPEADRPEKLKAFAEARKLDLSNWDLLTGDRAEVMKVGRGMFKADLARGATPDTPFMHNEYLYLVDSSRRIRGMYKAFDVDTPKLMARDMALLVKEEAQVN